MYCQGHHKTVNINTNKYKYQLFSFPLETYFSVTLEKIEVISLLYPKPIHLSDSKPHVHQKHVFAMERTKPTLTNHLVSNRLSQSPQNPQPLSTGKANGQGLLSYQQRNYYCSLHHYLGWVWRLHYPLVNVFYNILPGS